jgi:large subunit ribosomal protein L9
MEVILLEKMGKLGKLGDKVNVKAGFGRNYLLPFGKAVAATETNVAEFEARRAELELTANDKQAVAETRAAALAEVSIAIEAQAGEGGKLFGSVGPRDVADAITAAGVEVSKSEVRMPEGPIRELGEYQVVIHLHADVEASVALAIVPE